MGPSAWHTNADADPSAPRTDATLVRAHGLAHRLLRDRCDRVSGVAVGHGTRAAAIGRALRTTTLGTVLDDGPRPRGHDAAPEHDGHAEPPVRHSRAFSRLPPGQ